MRILIVRTTPNEFNLSKATYNIQGVGLATGLIKLGHEVSLVYYAKPGNERTETILSGGVQIKVYFIKGRRLLDNTLFDESLYQLCKEYDIIQPSEIDQLASWMLYKRFPEKTIIYHGPYKSNYTKKHNIYDIVFDALFIWRINYKNVHVLTKSVLAENDLRIKGFSSVKTVGVGLNPYMLESNVMDLPQIIQDLQANKNDNRYLLFIGEISHRKNLLFLIDILNRLVNNGNHINYKLIVVGKNSDQEYFDSCMKKVHQYNLDNNIQFCGVIEQKYLKELYSLADVFLLPTQYDIYGMVYLEAMYFGIPVVTTLCGGSSTLIENGKTGFIQSLDDPKGWERSIIDILTNQEKHDEMTREGMKLIRERYLWEKLATVFEQEYCKLLKLN